MLWRRLPRAVAAAALGVLVLGCSSTSTSPSPTSTGENTPQGAITVFAAASLTESFIELSRAFETTPGGAKVTLNLAASSTLAAQINQGAPADVFASADTANMDKVTGANGAGTAAAPVNFAGNSLRIIVGKGNPKSIRQLADLSRPGVVYLAAAANVPIARYAQQVLDAAKVSVTPRSLEPDVKAIVAKVGLGEADAGIVYATDVLAATDKVQGVEIPPELNVTARYPIATLKKAANRAAATAFVDFVTSAAGQAILAGHGFVAP